MSLPPHTIIVAVAEIQGCAWLEAAHTIEDETFEQFSREADLVNIARDAWINSITSGKPFNITKSCLACKEMGHTFQDCPILKNLAFLWRHFINGWMNVVQNQKMLHEAMADELDQRINQLKTEAADTQEQEEEQETVFKDETQAMDNIAKDFHQGGD